MNGNFVKIQIRSTKKSPMKKKITFALIAIITGIVVAILFVVARPYYEQAAIKARYSKIMARVDELKNAQEAYWQEHGGYAYHLKNLPLFTKEKESNIISEGLIDDGMRKSSINRNGVEIIGINENGGGAPVVYGLVYRGNEFVKYIIYLDHIKPHFSYGKGKRFCYSYTRDPNDWKYKFCAAMTGKSGPTAWSPDPKHIDPETGEDLRPVRFEF